MAHPYAYPSAKSGFHHQYRTQASTPSSSVSHLSVVDAGGVGSSFGAHLNPFEGSVSSGSSTHIPITPAEPPTPSEQAVVSTTGPERRRRRSTRGPPKNPSKKKSGEGVNNVRADPSEPLIPTRTYQFRSFDSFASVSAPPPDLAAAALPTGMEYTLLAPASANGAPNSATTPTGGPAPNGFTTDASSISSSSAASAAAQAKKTNALLNVGKRVVKEVLGGGGYNPQQKPETKVVYYGRGGAGGASTRSNTKQGSGHSDTQPFPSQEPAAPRSSSHYTNGSSGYTPSILSSPYQESVASSPYATSVDDASVYGSARSAPHTGSSLRPSTHPSPSHRSLSPAALSDSRRNSIVSSFPGTSSASDVEDMQEPSARMALMQAHRQRTYQGSSQRQMSLPIDEASPPADNHSASAYMQGAYSTSQQLNAGADGAAEVNQEAFTPMPQYQAPYPTYQSPSTTRANSVASDYAPSAPSSLFSSPQLPNGRMPVTNPGLESTVATFLAQAQLQAAAAQSGYMASAAGTRSLVDTQSGSSETVSHKPPLPTPTSSSSLQGWSGKPAEQAPTPIATTFSHPLPEPPTSRPAPRPLPDPLAQAVGQLSLMQNPTSIGWPRPEPIHQTRPQTYNNISYGSSISIDSLNGVSPNYGLPPPSVVTVTTVPAPPEPPTLPSTEQAILQAQREHEAIQQQIAQLERIQQLQQLQLQHQRVQQLTRRSSSLANFSGGYGSSTL